MSEKILKIIEEGIKLKNINTERRKGRHDLMRNQRIQQKEKIRKKNIMDFIEKGNFQKIY